MNNVSLVGRITKDPELKTFGKKDGSMCRFTLAIYDGVDADDSEGRHDPADGKVP